MREKVIHFFMSKLRGGEEESWRISKLEKVKERKSSAVRTATRSCTFFEAARGCTIFEAASPYVSTVFEAAVHTLA